jgi:hypothetical protein
VPAPTGFHRELAERQGKVDERIAAIIGGAVEAAAAGFARDPVLSSYFSDPLGRNRL